MAMYKKDKLQQGSYTQEVSGILIVNDEPVLVTHLQTCKVEYFYFECQLDNQSKFLEQRIESAGNNQIIHECIVDNLPIV